MKLQSSRINHFGHFVDFELNFGGAPFAVVYGQNEAGKSTLLEFLRKVLFGFDARERYSFGDGGEVSGQVAFDLADGRRVDLRRRKGLKNTVQVAINGVDAGLNEQSFSRLIGDPDADLFRKIFAFGLDELRQAEGSLTHESLRTALYAGGLGGSLNPTELLADLDKQAADLFKSGGSKPVINSLSREIGDLNKAMKSQTVRPDDYEQRRKEWSDKQTLADQLSERVNDLRIQAARTARLVDALPLWLKRRALQAEREALVVPVDFPIRGMDEFKDVLATIKRLTSEANQLQFELDEKQRQLGEIRLDGALLPLKTEISECHGLVKSVEEARRDLPLRRAELQAEQREVLATLQSLRPDWSLETLQAFAVDAATKHRLDELARRRVDRNNEQRELITQRDGARSELRQMDDDLAQLQEPRDLSALAALIEKSADYTADQRTLTKELEARSKLERTLELHRARLSPPLTKDATEVSQLPVPQKDLVEKFDRDFRDVAAKLAAAEQSVQAEEQRLQQLQVELQQLERQQRLVPKLEELQATRQRRDEGWQLIRDQHISGVDRADAIREWLSNDRAELPEVYEQTVQRADRMADNIYENADAVSRREQLKEQIEQVQNSLQLKQADVQLCRLDEQALAKAWGEVWSGCGFDPRTPDLMRSWCDGFAQYVVTFEAAQHKDIEIERLEQSCRAFEAEFRRTAPAGDGDMGAALAAVKQQVKQAETEAARRKTLLENRKRHQKALDTAESKLRDWQAAEQKWLSDWEGLLRQLQFPDGWDTELVRSVIERLQAARNKLAHVDGLKSRIAVMESRLNEFEPRVRQLGERLNEPVDADRPEIMVKQLHDRWTVAVQAQQRRESLEETQRELQHKLTVKKGDLQQAESRRAEWLVRAQVDSDERFSEVAERVRQANDLAVEIARLARDIELLRGNEPAAEFEAHLQTGDLAVLQAQQVEQREQLGRLEAESKVARESAGALRQVFEALDGSDQAARLQEDVARKQAELASQIHRYVPLVFARRLFQEAIQRFERENQPALIGDISKLFASLTCGRYVEIERPTSDREAIYVRRADGAERSPDQLSTGTREQLYLAIRLGYIQHYCRNAEPLPIVMDDVLVNFDLERARATLETLRAFSRDVQVLFFTCHRHVVDLIKDVAADVAVIELADRTPSGAAR